MGYSVWMDTQLSSGSTEGVKYVENVENTDEQFSRFRTPGIYSVSVVYICLCKNNI